MKESDVIKIIFQYFFYRHTFNKFNFSQPFSEVVKKSNHNIWSWNSKESLGKGYFDESFVWIEEYYATTYQ